MSATTTTHPHTPLAIDVAALPAQDRRTLDGLTGHPLSHNITWRDLVSLFEKIGTVEEKSNNSFAFHVGGQNRVLRKPHGKDLSSEELMEFRHLLTRGAAVPAV